jgi:predicted AAA+ superfamily ATPase
MMEPRRFIQVVAGPRQVGKSTLVNQVLETLTIPYQLFNADQVDPNDTNWVSQCWASARSTMRIKNHEECIIVIDEIQKISNWSEAVKREWDDDSRNGINLKVILLGSSRLMIRKGLTESLAGRFEMVRLGHWSYPEMKEAFGWSLDQWIYYGGYPGTAVLTDDERRWRRYIKDSLVTPAIEKDVIMTSRIYKPALMTQLFQLACGYSGELLSLTKMLGQLQDSGNVTTLQSYLDILDQCNLITGLKKVHPTNA